MGRSQLEKQKTHERIVTLAAKRLREEGLEGIGVADLMKEAGLTVGGFYKHFGSRDELVAEAVESAIGSSRRQLEEKGIAPESIPLSDYVDGYLSERHRDQCGEGCAYAALTADMARSSDAVRTVATEGLQRNFETMTARMPEPETAEARRKAIIASCLMTGALGLARVANDEALSNEILETVKEFVKTLPQAK
ncbi:MULTISPECIES: TetR/AcrR family transcriptional regulator [unclassified Rhizobium]|jgi:TetR/AcrR family transcriptional repressor of nem operon|uniref:TetR/AcrR family transcriptional regulator n=1 Tax=unclassified Rhizobium TaxID=2613769 RepID=UPI0006481F0C|nr:MULTISPECIES: TetR/AcrR family transcriptional regulator [unclassified Rhizobium]MBN8954122.1 TetR/AcrR family transcriptional regulator [Rhizobium tropici]OJY75874.1 MAG: TetR family transcriptional regulator [Rhizobium sp. 60-20]RKD52347.1 TetR family transcriptional regulator [Rhizobium sp. WW_1]